MKSASNGLLNSTVPNVLSPYHGQVYYGDSIGLFPLSDLLALCYAYME